MESIQEIPSDSEEKTTASPEQEEEEVQKVEEEEVQKVEEEVQKVEEEEEEDDDDDDGDNGKEERLRIVEGGLNYVMKSFDDFGDFYGLIISYNEPFFKVVYQDGDSEELSVEEAESYLVSVDDIPQETVKIIKQFAKEMTASPRTSSKGRKRKPKTVESPPLDVMPPSKRQAQAQEEGAEKKGKRGRKPKSKSLEKNMSLENINEWKTFVRKEFEDFGLYAGLVYGFDDPFYKVVYEDGDCEEVDADELKKLLVAANTVTAKTKRLLQGFAKSMTSDASPSDTLQSPEASPSREKEKKPESRFTPSAVTPVEAVAPKQSSKPRATASSPVKTSPVKTAAKEKQKYTFVKKSFGAMGEFHGLIVGKRGPYYKVVYEDGDSEELDANEVKQYSVTEASVDASAKQVLMSHARVLKVNKKKGHAGDLDVVLEGSAASDLSSEPACSQEGKSTRDTPSSVFKSFSPGGKVELLEPVEAKDNFVSKTFFGFGVFYGLIVTHEGSNYQVIYTDGDSEELSIDEVELHLTNPAAVPANIKQVLRKHAEPFRKQSTSSQQSDAEDLLEVYREVPADNIYQSYVGRSFVDTDENITYKVMSVCLHMDYDVLLFKYYDEFKSLSDPSYLQNQENYEYSACSEMLKPDSWCAWKPQLATESED